MRGCQEILTKWRTLGTTSLSVEEKLLKIEKACGLYDERSECQKFFTVKTVA
jgi:hypothetical protein